MNGKVNRSLPHDHDSFVCGEIHEKASKIRMFREYENEFSSPSHNIQCKDIGRTKVYAFLFKTIHHL